VFAGVSKTYQTIALYLGVFTIAYAGFFYQTYKIRLEAPDTYHQQATAWPGSNSSAVAGSSVPSASGTDFYSRSQPPGVNNSVQHRSSSKKPGADKASPGRADAGKQENHERTGEHRLSGKYFSDPVYYPDTQTAGSQPGVSPAYYSASATAYSATAPGTNTSSSFSSTSSSNTTVTAESTNTVAETDVSTNISSNSDNTIATSDDSTGTAYDEQLDTEEELWATPDCPYNLPEGSTEQDAAAMTEAYGCRYRYSCVNKNDGTGGYDCRWQYIRTF